MSAIRTTLMAAAILLLPTLPAAAGDNLPYCGDVPTLYPAGTPCKAWDGDIPATIQPGPFVACETTGRAYDNLNCIEIPMSMMPVHKGFSANVGRRLFGHPNMVVIAVRDAPIEPAAGPNVKRHWAKHPCAYDHYWWSKRHASAPGRDDEARERDVASAPGRPDQPNRGDYGPPPDRGWTETPDDPNPWNDGNEPNQPDERSYKEANGIRG